MTARALTPDDVRHLCTGATFVGCMVPHDTCLLYRDLILDHMDDVHEAPVLTAVGDLDETAMTTSLGYVNKGLMFSEMIPVGDEFETALHTLERQLSAPIQGLYPLAAASVNALVPIYVSLRTGLPVIDADPMGRVFPLLQHTTLTLAGMSAGPIGLTGPTGETAAVHVESPSRAELIVRALASEFGGWAATASYPISVALLARHGIRGSLSRLIEIGKVLSDHRQTQAKYAALTDLVGLRKVIRGRVIEVEGLSRPSVPGIPDRPSSVTLVDEARGRIVRMEIQNEILMLLVDGAVQAVLPDVITMVRPEDASVAGLEDLWVGNKIDLLSFPAPAPWYTPAGLALVEPIALQPSSRRSAVS